MPDPRILKDVIANLRMVHETLSMVPEGTERLSNMTTLLRDSMRAVNLYLTELERESEEPRELDDVLIAQLANLEERLRVLEEEIPKHGSELLAVRVGLGAAEGFGTAHYDHCMKYLKILESSINALEKKIETVKEYLDAQMEDTKP